MKHKLIQIVKGTTAKLAYCKGGKLFYQVDVEDTRYTFPIDVTDLNEVGDATFELEDKASIFMRYIRKSIDSETIRWETLESATHSN